MSYWALIIGYSITIAIYCLICFVLFRKWQKASPRYYSDIPFILGITFVVLIYNHLDSIFGLTGIMPITPLTQLIYLYAIVAIVCINLIIMLIIWMPERKRLRNSFIIGWFSLWVVVGAIFTVTFGTAEILHSLILMLSLPIMLLLTITWYFCYFKKRLTVINPLLVGIGFTIWTFSIILRVFISFIGTPIGYVFTDLHWIASLFDIAAFSMLLLGFSKEMKY